MKRSKSLPLCGSSLGKILINLTLVLMATFASRAAYGYDALGLGTVDQDAVGGVSSATTIPQSEWRSGLNVEGRKDALSKKALLNESLAPLEKETLIDTAYRGSALLGHGITEKLDLTLGLHFSYEDVDPKDRDVLLEKSKEDGIDGNWRGNIKDGAFSGASLMLKYTLVEWEGLKVAILPFVESGVGKRGQYALTRSDNPQGGVMTAASYGKEGAGELAMNLGYRYGKAENIGDITVGNEVFFKTALTGYLSKNFGVFVMSQARNVFTKPKLDAGAEQKSAGTSSDQEFGGGLVGKIEQTKISAYFLSGLKKDAVGSFISAAGLSLSFPVGFSSPSREFSKRDESKETVRKEPSLKTLYPEMYTDSIDLSDLEGVSGSKDDDFEVITKKMAEKEKARKAGHLSFEEKLEQDLAKIRETDRRTKINQEKTERAQALLREKQERARWQNNAAEEKRLKKEAQKRAAKLQDVITDDELNWKGLED